MLLARASRDHGIARSRGPFSISVHNDSLSDCDARLYMKIPAVVDNRYEVHRALEERRHPLNRIKRAAKRIKRRMKMAVTRD